MTEVYPDLLLVYRDKTAGSDVRYVNNHPEVSQIAGGSEIRDVNNQPEVR
jgi:hypothetical protein